MVDENGKHFDGYISSITLPNGKVYKLQCEVVEVYPMQCPRCGGRVELKYGSVACPICGTGTSIKSIPSVIFFRYCPYCGARLKGGAE